MNKDNRPIIETIINTIALALTAYGVQRITTGAYDGYLTIIFGMVLEFFKYKGRQKKLW